MCVMAEAVTIKSVAARRRALRHCVMRVNSRNDCGRYKYDHIIIIIAIKWTFFARDNNHDKQLASGVKVTVVS